MLIQGITVGAFGENTWVVADEESREGVLIDPGDEPDRIAAMIEELGVTIRYILNTHGHIDHVCAVAEMKRRLGVEFYLHPEDQFFLDKLPETCRMYGLPEAEVPTVDHPLAHGDTFTVGGLTLEVIFTPGHAPGHVSFLVNKSELFSGDCLFQGSVGRVDLPGGDGQILMDTLQNILIPLGDDVNVYPGHMGPTTIGRERATNPFLTGAIPLS
jgi:glyoxylase-like metal-dependent hydrolase (beta-lactamase superfamily II)